MIVVVNDANILIDIVELGIENLFFQLNLNFVTTDLVLGEVNDSQVRKLSYFQEKGLLKIESLSSGDLIELYTLSGTIGNLSDNDLSAFILSQKKNGILLTSDNRLRKHAKSQDKEVHGHLWIFDQLVDQGIMPPETASIKLKLLCEEVNEKLGLPDKECQRRYKKWRGSQSDENS